MPYKQIIQSVNKTMYRVYKLLIGCGFVFITLSFVFAGCDISTVQSKSNIDKDNFILKAQKADDFFVLSSDLDDTKKPRYTKYLFSGDIQNKTNLTYNSGTLRMVISLQLENGNILYQNDLNDIPFNDILSFHAMRDWKPMEKIAIRRLVSISIPVKYATYPIKDVIIEYSLDLEDQINQTSESEVIVSRSVMDKWKRAIKKVKANRPDTDDNDFPDKILDR